MHNAATSQQGKGFARLSSRVRGVAGSLIAGLALFLGTGCERTPDPCINFKWACLALTIEDGPPGIRRLSVFIDDGMVRYTEPTPMKPPKTALVYPLRFAVRFDEFDNAYRGFVDLSVSALNEDFDVVGFVSDKVTIAAREHKALKLSFGSPPDMADPPMDLSSPPPDMATPPDDMMAQPDMP